MTRGQIICVRCGQTGHVAASCPQPIVPLQLTKAEDMVLRHMRLNPPCDRPTMSEALGFRSKNHVRIILQSLMHLGLARRGPSLHPRSAPVWYLTEPGAVVAYEVVQYRMTPEKAENIERRKEIIRERNNARKRLMRENARIAAMGRQPAPMVSLDELEDEERELIPVRQVWRRDAEGWQRPVTTGVPSVFHLAGRV